jgi:hypothetical protein
VLSQQCGEVECVEEFLEFTPFGLPVGGDGVGEGA